MSNKTSSTESIIKSNKAKELYSLGFSPETITRNMNSNGFRITKLEVLSFLGLIIPEEELDVKTRYYVSIEEDILMTEYLRTKITNICDLMNDNYSFIKIAFKLNEPPHHVEEMAKKFIKESGYNAVKTIIGVIR